MNKNWYVIGLMSGTSLDGVDLVYVKISRNKAYDFEILQTKSINYSAINIRLLNRGILLNALICL